MPVQKFASRLPLDDLQNGAFINEGILYATPPHLLLFSFLSFFFLSPSLFLFFKRLLLADTLFSPIRHPPHDQHVLLAVLPLARSYFPLTDVFRAFRRRGVAPHETVPALLGTVGALLRKHTQEQRNVVVFDEVNLGWFTVCPEHVEIARQIRTTRWLFSSFPLKFTQQLLYYIRRMWSAFVRDTRR